jgi:hypothetical protein
MKSSAEQSDEADGNRQQAENYEMAPHPESFRRADELLLRATARSLTPYRRSRLSAGIFQFSSKPL